MTAEIEELKFWVYLLELEVGALRSVLAEFEGDKLEYAQMLKANNIEQLKNSLVHPITSRNSYTIQLKGSS